MSTAEQSIASQSSHLLTGQLQTLDPEEDNQENQDQQSEHQSDENLPEDLFSDDTNDGD